METSVQVWIQHRGGEGLGSLQLSLSLQNQVTDSTGGDYCVLTGTKQGSCQLEAVIWATELVKKDNQERVDKLICYHQKWVIVVIVYLNTTY